jgi:hypothetical protein
MTKLISKRLEQLERDIELGIQSVGRALTEIHESKAYKNQYDTFEVYCKTRWGFTDRYARDLIDAEAVRTKIGTLVPVSDIKTKHLVALSKVPAAKQAQVAASVIADAQAENRTPTEKDFKEAAKQFVTPKPEPKQAVETKPVAVKDAWEDVVDETEAEAAPKHDSVADRASKMRAMVKSHNAAMMRTVDDLHLIMPKKANHDTIHKAFRLIHESIEAWK